MNLFSELSLSPVVRGNLAKCGYTEPTPIQSQAIPAALSGRDIVATAQTGTGKTLAFVLPLIQSLTRAIPPTQPRVAAIRAVILSPTRELALQIQKSFIDIASGTGLKSVAVVGGLSENAQLQAIRKGVHVMIATPGRLCDFLGRNLVNIGSVEHLVLDEGDRMLDMGFLPAINRIIESLPASRQTLFFSATIEKSSARLVEKYLKNPVRITVGSATKPAEHVDLHVYEVEHDRKVGLLQSMLTSEPGSFLVFARTKHGVDRLVDKLSVNGFRAARIHGNRTQSQRNQALRGFQQGDYRILVATDVAARGIHVDAIAHVVNFDLPQAPEDFIHRVGRTGRAGARGTASTFGTPSERRDVREIERALNLQLIRREVPSDVVRTVGISTDRSSRDHSSRDNAPRPRGNRFRGAPRVRRAS